MTTKKIANLLQVAALPLATVSTDTYLPWWIIFARALAVIHVTQKPRFKSDIACVSELVQEYG